MLPSYRKGGKMNNNQQQRSFFFNVDWLMVFIYLALCAIGVLNPDHIDAFNHRLTFT